MICPVILRRSQEKVYNLSISHFQQSIGGTLSKLSRGMWPQIQANPKNFDKCPGDMWERSQGYLGMSNIQVKSRQKSCPSREGWGPPQPARKHKQKKHGSPFGQKSCKERRIWTVRPFFGLRLRIFLRIFGKNRRQSPEKSSGNLLPPRCEELFI